MLTLICACLIGGAAFDDQPEAAATVTESRWAVILTGLPGDDDHAELFAATGDAWQKWLTEELGIPAGQVIRLSGSISAEKPVQAEKPAEAEKSNPPVSAADQIRDTLASLGEKLKPEDALWIFTLGHGSFDGKRAWFHVAGRDPSAEDFGRWLEGVKCREQVLWLTHSSSGWWVKRLSQPGRIVIAATAAEDESNETEFPHALATVAGRSPEQLDRNGDGKVSVAELYLAVVAEVERRFKSDKRVPTEHAQLDDDGDGRGTEELDAVTEKPESKSSDGELARKTFISYRNAAKNPDDDTTKENANRR
ncbi:MAG: hypothetical protein HY290_24395 [Planctomycetia bacterium]|nr:hypothetical protein [Planctomycetia bacterium]